jgi:cold shock CspA family protein
MASGTVDDFDDAKGWGHVVTPTGERYFFHCTAIADGTRTIAEGTSVDFDVVAGHRGRFEARNLTRTT